ncbi:MAG: pyridoxamine 5'-phosphate oxidase family protein [Clostridia bacterium]|nr:pyridoxamine 5'-phosphate oxidase family protein [Clostridia bacterium]
MKEVYEFLKGCGAYYLATVDGDQPRVRPFGTVDLFDGKLYIQTGKKKSVAQQLKANPKVEIGAMAADGRWIRICAEAVLDENIKAQEHMLDAYPNLKAMYAPGDGNTEVYYLQNAVAQICSFTDAPRVIKF